MIKITGIKIGNHPIKVPQGLSELLDQSGAWSLQKKTANHEGYDRQVIRKDGKLTTVLTKANQLKKEA